MDDAYEFSKLQEKIRNLEERLRAVEKEQRRIREDILFGTPKERMQKRILERPSNKSKEIKEKIDKEFKIEI